MACGKRDFESLPTYSDLIRREIEFVIYELRRESTPEDELWHIFNFEPSDIALCLLTAVVLTILRYYATKWMFKPLGEICGLTEANKRKMPESAWRFTYCFLAWMYLYYVLILSGKYCFLQKPSTVWDGWTISQRPSSDIYSVHVLYAGIYVHATYGTLFLDTKRKDTTVVAAHHILTLFLIFSSYCLRYQNIALLALFVHEFSDIFLEFAKLNVYFKKQHGILVKTHDTLALVAFFFFVVSWFVCKLYWFPLKVLYVAHSVTGQKTYHFVWGITTNIMLWSLLIINIYWSMLIVHLVVRVATGQVTDLQDLREFDVEQNSPKSTKPRQIPSAKRTAGTRKSLLWKTA